MRNTAHSCTGRPLALLGLHCCPKRAEASPASLHSAGLLGHCSCQPQPQLTLSHAIKVGGEVLEAESAYCRAACVVLAAVEVSTLCSTRFSTCCCKAVICPCIPSINSTTGLSRPLISPLWRISDLQFGQSQERCPFLARWSKTGS